LDSFLRQARDMSAMKAAPSFLQMRNSGPYGEYKASGGGITSTLQELQTKVSAEKEQALEMEQMKRNFFEELDSSLSLGIENAKASMESIKTTIAESQEQSSLKSASLMEAQEIYKSTTAHVELAEAEYRRRTEAYKVRLGKRFDEAMAVHEAQRVLSKEAVDTYINKEQNVEQTSEAASFIQTCQERKAARLKVKQLFKQTPTSGLALLALKSSVHVRAGADPFSKVKSMITSMLKKLQEKQAQETRHAQWCDKEMGKTEKSQKRKQGDVQKIQDRLEALAAELTQTKLDITALKKDLADMKKVSAEAASLRKREHVTAVKAINTYKDAAALLVRALKILKAHYHKAKEGGAESDKEFKERHGLGKGIIGLLEIAIDNFESSHKEALEAEEAAALDFKESSQEDAVRMAVFEKDLENKQRTQVKLEFDQTTMTNDMGSYQKELTAIESYADKLKASCIAKGASYSERKETRERELSSLKDALEALKGA